MFAMATWRGARSGGGMRAGVVARRGGGRAGGARVIAKVVAAAGSTRPADAASRQAAALTAKQLVADIALREAKALGNNYAIAMALRELAKPARYHDEMKFDTFEALLDAHDLGSRMTAHKYITVADVFLEEHVRFIGGMEKAYLLIRWVRRRDAKAEPKELLAPGTKVLGKLVPELSVRDLRAALRELEAPPAATPASAAATKKGARSLRGAFRRVRIAAAVRAHTQERVPFVSAQLAVASAVKLAETLRGAMALRKAGST